MEENAKKKAGAKGGWRVVTFDNFHFMDEDEGGDGAGAGKGGRPRSWDASLWRQMLPMVMVPSRSFGI